MNHNNNPKAYGGIAQGIDHIREGWRQRPKIPSFYIYEVQLR